MDHSQASLEERLWRQVAIGGPDECWPWTSKSKTRGYGVLGIGGRGSGKILAHRAAWLVTSGLIPKMVGYHGVVIRHTCNNRLCCNPAHLMVGTQKDNVKDMWANKGGPRGNAKLTEAQIAAIRRDSRSSRVLGPIYGVCDAHIRNIRQGRSWKAA